MTYFYENEPYEILSKHNENGKLIDKILTEKNLFEVFIYEEKYSLKIVIAKKKM